MFYALLIVRDLLRKSGAGNDWKERCDELLKPVANSSNGDARKLFEPPGVAIAELNNHDFVQHAA